MHVCAFKIVCLAAPAAKLECFVNQNVGNVEIFPRNWALERLRETYEEHRCSFLVAIQMVVFLPLYCLYANKKCLIFLENLAKLKYSVSFAVNIRFPQFILAG